MSFTPRTYEDIVRDLLTSASGGITREVITVKNDNTGKIIIDKLKNRPVRRVTFVEEVYNDDAGREVHIRYTPNDYEIVSSADNGSFDTIRFKDEKKQPAPGSLLYINYYPVQTEAVTLTDLNVGSVTRTMMESFAAELAVIELYLDKIYKSAFLETATGNSLDKVVALIGVKRHPPGYPFVKLQFKRAPGKAGQITIPANTSVTDNKGNRYFTLQSLVLEPYENARETLAAGENKNTGCPGAGELNRLETMIEGIENGVTNLKPAYKQSGNESDEDLRRRSSGALHSVLRGTYDALKYGLLSIPEIKNVAINEWPAGVPGEINLEIAYTSNPSPELLSRVDKRIDELRPAGIRVYRREASKKKITVEINLTLANAGVSAAELDAMKKSIEKSVKDYLANIAPGGKARKAQIVSLILTDTKIIDAVVSFSPKEGAADCITLGSSQIFDEQSLISFPSITSEASPLTGSVTSTLSFFLPISLVSGVTLQEADSVLEKALDAYISTRSIQYPISVDTMAASIRDDTRYVLLRGEASITIESGENFYNITDGKGDYKPVKGETFLKGEINLDNREGGV